MRLACASSAWASTEAEIRAARLAADGAARVAHGQRGLATLERGVAHRGDGGQLIRQVASASSGVGVAERRHARRRPRARADRSSFGSGPLNGSASSSSASPPARRSRARRSSLASSVTVRAAGPGCGRCASFASSSRATSENCGESSRSPGSRATS
jgi:hypothetical protein